MILEILAIWFGIGIVVAVLVGHTVHRINEQSERGTKRDNHKYHSPHPDSPLLFQ